MTDFLLEIKLNPSNLAEKAVNNGSYKFGVWKIILSSKLYTNKDNVYYLGNDSNREGYQYIISINYEKLIIKCEKFGLSPIFYYHENSSIYVSSCISLIVDKIKGSVKLSINKRYILEQNLFNYALFNISLYNEIKLVPSNHHLEISDQIILNKIFNVEDLFCNSIVSGKKISGHLVDLFISLNEKKILNNDLITFTSGFDGRSLLSLALSSKKNVQTTSFGSRKNPDIILPQFQSKLLGLIHIPILLDDENYGNSFSVLAKNIIRDSAGASNLMQIHWSYGASILQNSSNTIITGIFGSELFRAAHVTGQFISPVLVNFFKYKKDKLWIDSIKNASSIHLLNNQEFKNEFQSLFDELSEYKKKLTDLTVNQALYKYVLEESFRKFFGIQFIVPMRKYLNVINPFIDIAFIKELFKTDLAGVNNPFFTHNPFVRLKGQLFYAELIGRTSSKIDMLSTGKGYRPKDLRTFHGKIRIASNYTKERLKRKLYYQDLDNLGIVSNASRFIKEREINQYSNLFNSRYIENIMKSETWIHNELVRNKLLEAISINYYLINMNHDKIDSTY